VGGGWARVQSPGSYRRVSPSLTLLPRCSAMNLCALSPEPLCFPIPGPCVGDGGREGDGKGTGWGPLPPAAPHAACAVLPGQCPRKHLLAQNRCFLTETQSSDGEQLIFTCSRWVRTGCGQSGAIPHRLHMGKGLGCSCYVWVE